MFKSLVILSLLLIYSSVLAQSPSGDVVPKTEQSNKTMEQYEQHFAWAEAHYTSALKQPDAQIIELGREMNVTAFHASHCMQEALMSNNIVAPVPCGHFPGEYLHAITTDDGLIIKAYITSREYKAWISNPKGE